MKRLTKLPWPIAGVALALASYGNLFTQSAPWLRLVLGSLSGLIMISLLLKLITQPQSLAEAQSNPVMAGPLFTFPMALMILGTYLLPLNPIVAKALWLIGLSVFIFWLVQFILRFMVNFELSKVFAGYFVPFVGFVVASLGAKVVGLPLIGQVAFWLGLIGFIAMLIIISIRYQRLPNIPPPARPTIAIYSAPASLLLAGYLNAFDPKATPLVYGLFLVALSLTVFGLYQVLKQLSDPFFPSIAAYTFPFVISAVASKMMLGYLKAQGISTSLMNLIVQAEVIIAGALLIFVLIRYFQFLSKNTAEKTRP